MLAGACRLICRSMARAATMQPLRFCSAKAPPPSSTHEKLMSFFDDKANWGKDQIRVGRAWNIDELRIKSNEDLHKLWFVLLKERNMLFTMEESAEKEFKAFPNPERIDKVQISMDNVETVVRERNVAYYELETGDTGQRPSQYQKTQLGLNNLYKFTEHLIPKVLNKKWRETHKHGYRGRAPVKFLKLYGEMKYNEKRRARNRELNHVQRLMKNIPHVNVDEMQQAYPHLNIKRLRQTAKSRGQYIPEEYA